MPPRRRFRLVREPPLEAQRIRRDRLWRGLIAVRRRWDHWIGRYRRSAVRNPNLLVLTLLLRSLVGVVPGVGHLLHGDVRTGIVFLSAAALLASVGLLLQGSPISLAALLALLCLSLWSMYQTCILLWGRWNLPPLDRVQKVGFALTILSIWWFVGALILTALSGPLGLTAVGDAPHVIVVGTWFQRLVFFVTVLVIAFLLWRFLTRGGEGRWRTGM